ncbi:iron ABC transporter substrate-binding protein [uncultured Pseudodesulfovibrio sp.]|uniref:iron ABC transporter substrate-binding protein n=1 Tax=uncultured Pseudodesulfovibrio sp. TaxID=2035858 RepID=UPI0029C74450|nr:iron ABC transporter substrate-binding protein [uncultured Pseudodesulfovibrio sp.]
MKKQYLFCAVLLLLVTIPASGSARSLTDSSGRTNDIPDKVDRVICSGPGALRLLTYLQAQDRIVAVDDAESTQGKFDARPYALANPQFMKLPIFGEFRGHDNPELILTLERQPQVILKTYGTMGHDPQELQDKTGIPVVVLNYGNLGKGRPQLYKSLRLMGEVMGKEQRAEEVIAYIDGLIDDLSHRTGNIPGQERSSVFVGGVAFKGPHGFQSTEPTYPPFQFINAINLAYEAGKAGKSMAQSNIAKEKIVEWDPDVLFLDLATLQLGEDASGLYELRNDPAYRTLTAVKDGRVYGVLPYNWYTRNFGSILANAYFVGKVLYPDRFADVDPAEKADEIYTFLVGKPVFAKMDALFDGMAYKPIAVN